MACVCILKEERVAPGSHGARAALFHLVCTDTLMHEGTDPAWTMEVGMSG